MFLSCNADASSLSIFLCRSHTADATVEIPRGFVLDNCTGTGPEVARRVLRERTKIRVLRLVSRPSEDTVDSRRREWFIVAHSCDARELSPHRSECMLTVCRRLVLQRNLTEYFNAVDTTTMMTVFASMLNERRIIITSKRLSRLTACVQAANSLIFPMYWYVRPQVIHAAVGIVNSILLFSFLRAQATHIHSSASQSFARLSERAHAVPDRRARFNHERKRALCSRATSCVHHVTGYLICRYVYKANYVCVYFSRYGTTANVNVWRIDAISV